MKPGSLSAAIVLATTVHEGQIDKAGELYVFHPLRLMLGLQTEEERIVAMLHDVVEDTPITFVDLRREGFSEPVLTALECLTHREGEDYSDYILRVVKNPLAARVKLADLKDNMDLSRIAEPTEKDMARINKYAKTHEIILNALED